MVIVWLQTVYCYVIVWLQRVYCYVIVWLQTVYCGKQLYTESDVTSGTQKKLQLIWR